MNELFEQLVYDALKEKVSDIHLLSKKGGFMIMERLIQNK